MRLAAHVPAFAHHRNHEVGRLRRLHGCGDAVGTAMPGLATWHVRELHFISGPLADASQCRDHVLRLAGEGAGRLTLLMMVTAGLLSAILVLSAAGCADEAGGDSSAPPPKSDSFPVADGGQVTPDPDGAVTTTTPPPGDGSVVTPPPGDASVTPPPQDAAAAKSTAPESRTSGCGKRIRERTDAMGAPGVGWRIGLVDAGI